MRVREVEVLDNFVVLSILSMMADSRCIRLQRDCSRFCAACVRQGKNDVKFFLLGIALSATRDFT